MRLNRHTPLQDLLLVAKSGLHNRMPEDLVAGFALCDWCWVK